MLPREVRIDGLFSNIQLPEKETRNAIREHIDNLVAGSGSSGRGYVGFARIGRDALTPGGLDALAQLYQQNYGKPPEHPINLQGVDIICQVYLVGVIEANKHSKDLDERVSEFVSE